MVVLEPVPDLSTAGAERMTYRYLSSKCVYEIVQGTYT